MKKSIRKTLIIALILIFSLSAATTTAFGVESNGINVQYNGQNIIFTDAAPKIIDGRTMVPFRQILETMGAKVTYDYNTQTITAKTNNIEFSFAVNGTDIKIIENGITTIKKMDVKPFIDASSSRTYVPVRFMAESMGYSVSWDQYNKTAVIIDPSSIFANADSDFSIISKLMTNDLDLEKPYETTSDFDIDMSVYDSVNSKNLNFNITGDMSGVQQKSDADLIIKFLVNADEALNTMSIDEQAAMKPMLDLFKDVTMNIKMNGETGIMYMNSTIFSTIDPSIDNKTWLKMNAFEMYDEMGINLRPMMDVNYADYSISKMLEAAFASMSNADINTYKDVKTAYVFIKNLAGDESFKSQIIGDLTTYSLNLDKASITAALAKTALTDGLAIDAAEIKDLGDALNNTGFSADLIIKEKAGIMSSYDLKASGISEDVSFSLNLTGTQYTSKIVMTIDQTDFMKFNIIVNSNLKETIKTPDLTLPSDAKILDYNSIMPAM